MEHLIKIICTLKHFNKFLIQIYILGHFKIFYFHPIEFGIFLKQKQKFSFVSSIHFIWPIILLDKFVTFGPLFFPNIPAMVVWKESSKPRLVELIFSYLSKFYLQHTLPGAATFSRENSSKFSFISLCKSFSQVISIDLGYN